MDPSRLGRLGAAERHTFRWWDFRLSLIAHWNFGLYVFVIVYASMYFMLAAMLFPDDLKTFEGFDDVFARRRGWFFGLVAATELMDVVDTWLKGNEHLASLGPAYIVRIVGLAVLCLIAARTRNLMFHRIFVVAALVYEASFFTHYYTNLT